MSFNLAQAAASEPSMPGYLFAGSAIALFGLVQVLLSARRYRGIAPTDERPVVFQFSRIWLIGINALAICFLIGPYLFPDSPEEQARSPWVAWLLPMLAGLLVLASEYLRITQRIEVYRTYFAFPSLSRRHEVRFSEVESIEIIGTGIWVRLKSNESYSFAAVFGRTSTLVSLLRAKVTEANPTGY